MTCTAERQAAQVVQDGTIEALEACGEPAGPTRPTPMPGGTAACLAAALSPEEIPGVEPLAGWVRELATLAATGVQDAEAWALAGTAVVIVSPDVPWTEAVLARLASEHGLALGTVEPAGLPGLEPEAAAPDAPALLLLRHGAWAQPADPEADDETRALAAAGRARVEALLDGFDAESPVVLVTIMGSLTGDIDVELRRVGGFERFISLPGRTDALWGRWLVAELGEDQVAPSLTRAAGLAGAVFAHQFETERRRALAIRQLRRRGHLRGTPVEFLDVVDLCARGFVEGVPHVNPADRKHVAVHEAGHVVLAMVSSDWTEVPEYSSIIPSSLFEGVVVDPAERAGAPTRWYTYATLQQQVRELLAGRAAEQVVFGVKGLGTGSTSDLEKASEMARRAFSRMGFAPRMEQPGRTGSNLAVLDDDEGTWRPEAAERIDALVREFLMVEYTETVGVLEAHRPLLDRIAARLVAEQVLGREAFVEEAARAGFTIRASGARGGAVG